MDGFRHGFRLMHEGELTQEEPANDPSIEQYPEAAAGKNVNRGKPPFDTPPFSKFHVSPIKLREKQRRGNSG